MKLRHYWKLAVASGAVIVVPVATLWILLYQLHINPFPLDFSGQTWCVDPVAAKCERQLSSAIDMAHDGDIIRLGQGTYTESIVLTKSVLIEGGWRPDFIVRDPAQYTSTLRAPENSHTSVLSIRFASPTIDGLHVTGGQAHLSTEHGGGIQLIHSDAVVRNSVIAGNMAHLYGGGVWISHGSPLLENNRIEHNIVIGDTCLGCTASGGGLALDSSSASIINNHITHNEVQAAIGLGAGIDIRGPSDVLLRHNVIGYNRIEMQALVHGYGAGLSANVANIYLQNNEFVGNTLYSTNGGAGGGIYISGVLSFTLENNLIAGNFVFSESGIAQAGGLYAGRSRGFILGTRVLSNTASSTVQPAQGGGLAFVESEISITGGEYISNVVSTNGEGGGLYANASDIVMDAVRVESNFASRGGSAILLHESPSTATNLLLAHNQGGQAAVRLGAGSTSRWFNNSLVNNDAIGLHSSAPLTLVNSLVVSHSIGVQIDGVSLVAHHNGYWANGEHIVGSQIDSSSLVLDPMLALDATLAPQSPYVDAGQNQNAPTHDLAFAIRPQRGTTPYFATDIGAYEASGTPQEVEFLADSTNVLAIVGLDGSINSAARHAPAADVPLAHIAGILNTGGDDLMLRLPNNANAGRVAAIKHFGERITGTIDLTIQPPELTVSSSQAVTFGTTISTGDINGDGLQDLIVGANPQAGGEAPSLMVAFGSNELSGAYTLDPTLPNNFELRAAAVSDVFAQDGTVAVVDLNLDSLDDLIAISEDSLNIIFGRSQLNGVWDLNTEQADIMISNPFPAEHFQQLAAGHLDHDGFPDIALRTMHHLYVFAGPFLPNFAQEQPVLPRTVLHAPDAGPLQLLDLFDDGVEDIALVAGQQLYLLTSPLVTGNDLSVESASQLTITDAPIVHLTAGNIAGQEALDLVVAVPAQNAIYVVAEPYLFAGSHQIDAVASKAIMLNTQGVVQLDLASGDADGDRADDLLVGTKQDEQTPNYYLLYGDANPRSTPETPTPEIAMPTPSPAPTATPSVTPNPATSPEASPSPLATATLSTPPTPVGTPEHAQETLHLPLIGP